MQNAGGPREGHQRTCPERRVRRTRLAEHKVLIVSVELVYGCTATGGITLAEDLLKVPMKKFNNSLGHHWHTTIIEDDKWMSTSPIFDQPIFSAVPGRADQKGPARVRLPTIGCAALPYSLLTVGRDSRWLDVLRGRWAW
jgi:hypothetical protein